MSTTSSSRMTITKFDTESPQPSNKHSRKTNVDLMRLLSKENYNTRKMEQERQSRKEERQGHKAMETNQNQLPKCQDNSSGCNKDDTVTPFFDETRNYSKMSTTNEMKEMEERIRYSKKHSNEIPTRKGIFHSDFSSTVGLHNQAEPRAVCRRPQVNHQVGPQETEQQEMNMQSASSAWISDAVPTKRSDKKHQDKELQLAISQKATRDRHHTRSSTRYPEPEIPKVETNKEDQQSHVLTSTPRPELSDHQAAFELTRERATTAIKNSQIARAAATKVIVESQAVRARVEKALQQRLANRSHAESAERGKSSRERSIKTVIASSVDGSVEDILEMDKNNNKEIVKEAIQEAVQSTAVQSTAVQSTEKSVQKALQSQDKTVQQSAGSPQTSNSPINTMDLNTNDTYGSAAAKVSKYTRSMDEYKIEFVSEAEDDAENMNAEAEAEDDWVKVMDYDEDEDEIEEDGWLLA